LKQPIPVETDIGSVLFTVILKDQITSEVSLITQESTTTEKQLVETDEPFMAEEFQTSTKSTTDETIDKLSATSEPVTDENMDPQSASVDAMSEEAIEHSMRLARQEEKQGPEENYTEPSFQHF